MGSDEEVPAVKKLHEGYHGWMKSIAKTSQVINPTIVCFKSNFMSVFVRILPLCGLTIKPKRKQQKGVKKDHLLGILRVLGTFLRLISHPMDLMQLYVQLKGGKGQICLGMRSLEEVPLPILQI